MATYQNLTEEDLINALEDSTILAIAIVAHLVNITLKNLPLALVAGIKEGHHYRLVKQHQCKENKPDLRLLI